MTSSSSPSSPIHFGGIFSGAGLQRQGGVPGDVQGEGPPRRQRRLQMVRTRLLLSVAGSFAPILCFLLACRVLKLVF
jgi:hypothetical protein